MKINLRPKLIASIAGGLMSVASHSFAQSGKVAETVTKNVAKEVQAKVSFSQKIAKSSYRFGALDESSSYFIGEFAYTEAIGPGGGVCLGTKDIVGLEYRLPRNDKNGVLSKVYRGRTNKLIGLGGEINYRLQGDELNGSSFEMLSNLTAETGSIYASKRRLGINYDPVFKLTGINTTRLRYSKKPSDLSSYLMPQKGIISLRNFLGIRATANYYNYQTSLALGALSGGGKTTPAALINWRGFFDNGINRKKKNFAFAEVFLAPKEKQQSQVRLGLGVKF